MWSLVEEPATVTANLPHLSLFCEEKVLRKVWSLFSAMSAELHCSLADDHHCRLAGLAAVWHRLAVIREQRVLTCRKWLVEGADVHCTWLGMAIPYHKGCIGVEPWDKLDARMGENCSLYYSLQAYLAPETSLPRVNKYFSRSQKRWDSSNWRYPQQ